MKKIMKNLRLFLFSMLFFYCANNLHAQENWIIYNKFPQICNINVSSVPYCPIDQFGELIYFPNVLDDKLAVMDFYGYERVYTPFNTSNPSGCFEGLRNCDYSAHPEPNYAIISQLDDAGVLTISNQNTNPKMKFNSFNDMFGMSNPPSGGLSLPVSPMAVCLTHHSNLPQNRTYWAYIDVRDDKLKYADVDNPDSVVKEYGFAYNSTLDTGFEMVATYKVTDLIGLGGDLFFNAKTPKNAIIKLEFQFNPQNPQASDYVFKRHKITELPLEYDTLDGSDAEYTLLGPDKLTNRSCYWIVKVHQEENEETKDENLLLIYDNFEGKFKSTRMNPGNTAKYFEYGKCDITNFGKLNDTIIYFTYKNINSTDSNYRTELITYNTVKEEYKSICVPAELVDMQDGDYIILSARELTKLDDSKVIGILLNTGHFLFYNNTTSIKEITEGRFQEIGVRSIYPNPATTKFTANIMCYVPNFNEVNVGLYDIFGQLIMDVSNLEYSQGTNTLRVDFNVPPNFATGIYYLKVNKGTETVAKSVVILGN